MKRATSLAAILLLCTGTSPAAGMNVGNALDLDAMQTIKFESAPASSTARPAPMPKFAGFRPTGW